MKKFLNGSVAALVAIASVVTAIPASAKPGGGGNDGKSEQNEGNRDRGDRPGQWDRHDNRYDGKDHDRRNWNRGAHDNGEHRGHGGGERRWRYYGGNYGYDGYDGRWRSGQRYPYWRDRSYYLSDYGSYGLPAPRRGYRYYRADNGNIVMVAIASGIIGMIVGGALADNNRRR